MLTHAMRLVGSHRLRIISPFASARKYQEYVVQSNVTRRDQGVIHIYLPRRIDGEGLHIAKVIPRGAWWESVLPAVARPNSHTTRLQEFEVRGMAGVVGSILWAAQFFDLDPENPVISPV